MGVFDDSLIVDVVMVDNLPKMQKVHFAIDCGIIINSLSVNNQIEGGIVDGSCSSLASIV